MNTENGNRLIAEFMGATWVEDDYGNWGYKSAHFPTYFTMFLPKALQYHRQWDWLMPVVEKIESLGFIFTISEQYCNIQDSKNNASLTGVMYAPTKKEVVYNACVRFIELHIAQKERLKILNAQ